MTNGYLVVNVYSDTIANPVKGATVKVKKDGVDIATETTDEDGRTPQIKVTQKKSNTKYAPMKPMMLR